MNILSYIYCMSSIVDPEENLNVTVYDLEHDAPPKLYAFADTIPVRDLRRRMRRRLRKDL